MRARLLAATLVCAMGLAGCSAGDGVELNGRLLDAVGLSTAALGGSRSEPQLQPRAPLVMPPSTSRLPEPGSVPQPPAVAADQSWPADRDHQRVATAADRKRQQDEYCRSGNWRERAMDPMGDKGTRGPEGTCGSIFSWTQGLFGTGKQSED